MTGLEEAFYIVALVYMGISLIIVVALLAAVLVIRHKVVNLEKMIKDKVDMFTSIPTKVGEVIETVQNIRKGKSK